MITYRTATEAELSLIMDWAASEGWNPGQEDAHAFWQADPDGFFVATQNDTPIAAISIVNHSDRFAFLGLYIARPEHRGKGIGYALWQHALAHAGNRTVGLDGVPDQQENYAASGFQLFSATTRFTGRPPAVANPDIRIASLADVDTLIDMEGTASGVHKPAYLRAWFTPTDTRQTLVLEDHAIKGCCTCRLCRSGVKIGPLIANTAKDATALIAHAASLYDSELTIDVPDTSKPLKDLCADLSLTPGFTTARMYRGPFTSVRHDYFALTTMELG